MQSNNYQKWITLFLLITLQVYLVLARRGSSLSRSSSRSSYSSYRYSRYSYGYRSGYSGYSRYSYRYSSSYYTYRYSSVRYSYRYTRLPIRYSGYVSRYYYYYSYYYYNSYYGGTCHYTSTRGSAYCTTTTTTTTTAAPTRSYYQQTCDNRHYTTSVGVISSHTDYDGNTLYANNMNCYWSITAPAGYRIQLQFSAFKTEKSYDIVRVYEGVRYGTTVMAGSIIGSYSGTSSIDDYPPSSIISTGRYLYIRFESDGSNRKTGFRALWTAVSDSSISTTVSSSVTTINPSTTTTSSSTTTTPVTTTTTTTTTPMSPSEECSNETNTNRHILYSHQSYGNSSYPNRYQCAWKITANPGYIIQLTFLNLQMESCYDKVFLRDGPNSTSALLVALCSTTTPNPSFYSTGQFMYIHIQTDASVARAGFMALYSSVLQNNTVQETQPSDNLDESLSEQPEYRNENSSEVCSNYVVNANGTAMGSFTCPNAWEPKDFTQCCGDASAQYCCRVKDNNPMVIGAIIGAVCAVIVFVVVLVCCIRCCREKPPKKLAHITKSEPQKTWRRNINKVRMAMAWKHYQSPSAPPPYSKLDPSTTSNNISYQIPTAPMGFTLPVPPPPTQIYDSNLYGFQTPWGGYGAVNNAFVSQINVNNGMPYAQGPVDPAYPGPRPF